jgi:MFS family permease
MFLSGLNVFLGLNLYFLERSLGLGDDDVGFWIAACGIVVGVMTAIATIPSGLASNRVGRKPLIYVACAIGAAGMAIAGLAPNPVVLVLGVVMLGIASGTFVAVDWALMTDIIPKASSGRFMGISNLAVGLAGAVALAVGGPIMDYVGGPTATGDGPRAAFLAAIGLFALAAAFLLPVDPRPRELREAPVAPPA